MNIETLQAYITLIKDIVSGLAAATATVIAIMGFRTWKKQLHWKTQYEVAQRLVKVAYRLREAFSEVRKPRPTAEEMYEAHEEFKKIDPKIVHDELDEQAFRQDIIHGKRWRKVKDVLIELDAVSLEAEAIWGSVVKEKLEPLVNCSKTLDETYKHYSQALHGLADLHYRNDSPDWQIMRSATDEKDNFFTNEINEAVKKIENFLKPYLKI